MEKDPHKLDDLGKKPGLDVENICRECAMNEMSWHNTPPLGVVSRSLCLILSVGKVGILLRKPGGVVAREIVRQRHVALLSSVNGEQRGHSL